MGQNSTAKEHLYIHILRSKKRRSKPKRIDVVKALNNRPNKSLTFQTLQSKLLTQLEASRTPYDSAHAFMKFAQAFCGATYVCLRSVLECDLHMRCWDCEYAEREPRKFKIDGDAIVCHALRKELCIIEGDQLQNKMNRKRPDDSRDEGSLMTIVFQDRCEQRWQLTVCAPQKKDAFHEYHCVVLYQLFTQFLTTYYALSYYDVSPILEGVLEKYADSVGSWLSTVRHHIGLHDLASKVNDVHPNVAFLVSREDGDSITPYPILLPTSDPLGGSSSEWRDSRKLIFAKIVNYLKPTIVAVRDSKLILTILDEDSSQVSDNIPDLPQASSIAIIPIVVGDAPLAFLWLELHDDREFRPKEIIELYRDLLHMTPGLVCQSVGRQGHLIDHFVANTAVNQDMQDVFDQMKEAAKDPDRPVLIYGESGSGKEVVAMAIHRMDHNDDRAFEQYKRCSRATPPETIMRLLSEKGTVVLDHLERFSPETVAQLEGILQERIIKNNDTGNSRPVLARIIGIVNKAPGEEAEHGRLPPEFVSKFASPGIVIRIPPLRERSEEIESIILYWLRGGTLSGGPQKSITADVIKFFKKYDWPDNVRELFSVVYLMCKYAGDTECLGEEHLKALNKPHLMRGGEEMKYVDWQDYALARRAMYLKKVLKQSWNTIADTLGKDSRTITKIIDNHKKFFAD